MMHYRKPVTNRHARLFELLRQESQADFTTERLTEKRAPKQVAIDNFKVVAMTSFPRKS